MRYLFVLIFLQALCFSAIGQKKFNGEAGIPVAKIGRDVTSRNWHASWIGLAHLPLEADSNAWTSFRKKVFLKDVPESVVTRIAVDSKYWLWINGTQVIFEGGLNRGPTPQDTYYDKVDIAKYLRSGENTIAVLVWYWGQEGFSHHDSGKGGFLFEADMGGDLLISDKSWKVTQHPAYLPSRYPNYRLSASNIHFDARRDIPDWYTVDYDDTRWSNAVEFGNPPVNPWNKLVERPIPLIKNYGLKSYINSASFPRRSNGEVIVAKLPYNAQITPYLKVRATAGQRIRMYTDNLIIAGSTAAGSKSETISSEYITRDGLQEFEAYAWMNGHEVRYDIPAGVEIIDLKFRETGYNTKLEGVFSSNDPFLNKLWTKSQRTLYLNMRDNYMDCPDRERAQWWGDVVLALGESFYAFDTDASLLTKKAISNLVSWQRDNHVLYSPVPSVIFTRELPQQMLASVGTYGFWTYYMYTGDLAAIKEAYPHVREYLSVYQMEENGLLKKRTEERKYFWDWGDWGQNVDKPLLENAWYSLALQGALNMAKVTGNYSDTLAYTERIAKIKTSFNDAFWNGKSYRSKMYTGETDDRGNGLAVIAGIADQNKWEAIQKVLSEQAFASPYMEKYVLESYFKMQNPRGGLERMKTRYREMVQSDQSTLWELWEYGTDTVGTNNHGWTGGPLTLLSQYVAGIAPVSPGYDRYHILPQFGDLKEIKSLVKTIKGDIKLKMSRDESQITMEINSPANTSAIVGIPKTKNPLQSVVLNNKKIWEGKSIPNMVDGVTFQGQDEHYYLFAIPPGKWIFKGTYNL